MCPEVNYKFNAGILPSFIRTKKTQVEYEIEVYGDIRDNRNGLELFIISK